MSRFPDSDHVIRITPAEVASSHVDDLLKRQASLRGEAGITGDRRRTWYLSNWFVFMLAGAVGAFAGWALWEPAFNDLAYVQGPIEKVQGSLRELRVPGEDQGVDLREPGFGLVTIGGEDFLLIPATRPFGAQDRKAKIDSSQLVVGKEVGVYLDDDSIDEVGLPAVVSVRFDPPPRPGPPARFRDVYSRQRAAAMLLFPTVAALAGLGIGAADGLVCRLWRRVLLAGLVGLLVGFIGCFVSAILANIVYAPLTRLAESQSGAGPGDLSTLGLVIQVSGRGLAWCLAGMAMGLGQGVALRSSRLLLYGFIGGAIGGLLGGLLFDPISLALPHNEEAGAEVSRGVGFTIIGAGVGLMIGVVELLARDAWLRMIQGPLAGKEFLVFKDLVHVGASPRSDIYLFNDPEVADSHAVIRAAADQYEIEAVDPLRPVLVNGRPVGRARLRHGDQITLGRTVFAFNRKRTDS